MPRGVPVSEKDAVRVVETYIEHFKTAVIPKSTSDVWRRISEDLNNKWSPQSAYVSVRENRRAILSTARSNKRIIIENPDESKTCSDVQKKYKDEQVGVETCSDVQKKDEDEQVGVESAEDTRIDQSQMEVSLDDDSIQQIGSIPFRVFYTTSRQMQAFNEYCQREESVVKIDMRKDLMRKIDRGDNSESGEILLISMIIYFKGKHFLAYQMITEVVDFPLILYWLGSWIQKGAHKPKEAISNYCRVFLAAMCLAFNGFSLEHYISGQFASVSSRRSSYHDIRMAKPKTFIRVDINDLLRVVSQWRCFQNIYHPCVREFYIRCVDLLIRAQSFDEFEELLFFIIVVAVSLFEDDFFETEKFTSKIVRKKLEAVIAVEKNFVEIPDYEEDNDLEQEQPVLEYFLIHKDELGAITLWINEIVEKAKSSRRGSEINAFYLPKFADQLVALALDFPLWTSFTPLIRRTSTWKIDEYFRDWEPRILERVPFTEQFPVQADQFVIAHLQEITESVRTFEMMLTDSGGKRTSADGTQKTKGSRSNEQVFLLRNNDTSFLTKHLYFVENNNSTTFGKELVAVAKYSDYSELQSSVNSPEEAPINNILPLRILKTDKRRNCHKSIDSSKVS